MSYKLQIVFNDGTIVEPDYYVCAAVTGGDTVTQCTAYFCTPKDSTTILAMLAHSCAAITEELLKKMLEQSGAAQLIADTGPIEQSSEEESKGGEHHGN